MDTCGLCPVRDQMPCVQRIPCRASRCSFFETFVPFSVSWLQRLQQRPLPPCLGTSCCDRNMPRIIGIHTGIHVIILINVYSCYAPRFAIGMEQHARRSLKHNYQPKCLINIFASCQLVVMTKVANRKQQLKEFEKLHLLLFLRGTIAGCGQRVEHCSAMRLAIFEPMLSSSQKNTCEGENDAAGSGGAQVALSKGSS